MDKPKRYVAQKQQELRSRRQFCEHLDEFGWLPSRPDEDLGEDFIVHIYFEGRATGVTFHAQLKSVTNLNERRQEDYLVYDGIKVKDLKHWAEFELPVVLIVWDVNLREGRWALVADLIDELDQWRPQWRENKSKVRVPWGNGTDDEGLVRLRLAIGRHLYPLLASGRPIELDVNLNLSTIKKGQINIEEKRELYRHSDSPLDQLYTIQEKLGHLPPIPETGLTQADKETVRELRGILDHGQRVTKLAHITADFRGLVLQIILDAHRRGNAIYIRKLFEESFVELFDSKISTGRMTQ